MKAIPEMEEPQKYTKTDFCNSEFVEIKSNNLFMVSMQYPLLGMKNAEKRCLVRKEVYDMLVEAVRFLPGGYKLKILDAWRPFALQQELYEVYSAKLVKDFKLEECTEEQKKAIICKFVSDPDVNRDIPPVHTTGGAVDVTIIDKDGCELEMGTGFDAFTNKTNTAYFESVQNNFIRNNRRMLYHAMTKVRFTNLPSEWWHFDYGDRFWAYYKNQPAMYRGVFTKKEINGK